MAWTIPDFLRAANTISFVRQGASFAAGDPANPGGTGAGTVGVNAKPAATDAAWIGIGAVNKVQAQAQSELKKVFAAVGATLQKVHTYRTKAELTTKFTAVDIVPLAVQLAFGTQPLDSSVLQFNPLAAGTTQRGWMKLEIRNQETGGGFIYADFWGDLAVPNGLDLDPEAHVEVAYEFENLFSAIATMSKA